MIELLEWDSDFFSKQIGKYDIEDKFKAKKFYEAAKQFDLVYVFSTEPVHINARLMDIKLTFSKQIIKNTALVPSIHFFDKNKHSYQELLELVYLSGHESRFLKDVFFSESDFIRMYNIWIDNNLKNDNVLVHTSKNKINGFVSYAVNENFSLINLIAVDPNAQGQGIGVKLLSAVEQNLKENSILKVPTQESNIGACEFYKACGFKALTKQYIYHYEPNSI